MRMQTNKIAILQNGRHLLLNIRIERERKSKSVGKSDADGIRKLKENALCAVRRLMKDNFVMIIAICAPTSGDILCGNMITNVTTTARAPAQIKDNRSAVYLRILQTNRKPSCSCRAEREPKRRWNEHGSSAVGNEDDKSKEVSNGMGNNNPKCKYSILFVSFIFVSFRIPIAIEEMHPSRGKTDVCMCKI